MIFAKSTGKIYYTPGKEDMIGQLVRFDPDKPGPPTPINAELGLRSATQETPQGIVYTVSKGGKRASRCCSRSTRRPRKSPSLVPRRSAQ